MTILRVGSTQKYADGWNAVFGKSKSTKSSAAKSVAGKTSAKKASAKVASVTKSSTKKKTSDTQVRKGGAGKKSKAATAGKRSSR